MNPYYKEYSFKDNVKIGIKEAIFTSRKKCFFVSKTVNSLRSSILIFVSEKTIILLNHRLLPTY